MEKSWVMEQKKLFHSKVLEKIEKGKKRSQYSQKCLQMCKEWKGPAASVDELQSILNLHPQQREKIVRNELIYFRETHKSEVLFNPSLFRVNNISHEDRLLNLCALLAEDVSCGEPSTLPSNNDAEIVIGGSSLTTTPTQHQIQVGKYYITLLTEGTKDTWYLASCEGINNDGTFKMDHLMRAETGSSFKWKHPSKPDSLDLNINSILDCEVIGEWDVSNERALSFSLQNHINIALLITDIFNK